MEELLGSSPLTFVILSGPLFGGAAFMAGQAVAAQWRPWYQTIVYCLLLAAAERFFDYALFDGELLAPLGYLVAALILIGFGFLGFRLTQVHAMVTQYPWLYERAGLFSWRSKGQTPDAT